MVVSQHSSPTNPYLPNNDEALDSEEQALLKKVKDKLKNKTYWAIYFSPKKLPDQIIFDGDISIFLDAISGEILLIRSFKTSLFQ